MSNYFVSLDNDKLRIRNTKVEPQFFLPLYPVLLLLPERFDGYYDFVCTQLQPHVYDFLLLPDLLNDFKQSKKDSHARIIFYYYYQYYFPVLSEFAFAQAMLFLPHILALWDDAEHPFFARVAQAPDHKDHTNYCSRLALQRLQLAQKLSRLLLFLNGTNTPLTRHSKNIFLTSNTIAAAEDPIAFTESYYNKPHMIMLRQLLEMVPPHVIKENWRYQFTLGLMHLYCKNYSAAFKYFQEVQALTERQKLTDFAQFSSYIEGCDSVYKGIGDEFVGAKYDFYPKNGLCFAHDLLANKTITEVDCENSNKRTFAYAQHRNEKFSKRDQDVIEKEPVTDFLQRKLEGYVDSYAVEEWWQKNGVEIAPHFFTKIFTPKSKIGEQLFNEYQALIQCLPTLLTCCRQGLAVPDFTYSLRKRIAKSAQGFVAAQVKDEANTLNSDYFSSILQYNYSLDDKDFVYSGSKLRRYTTSRLMWELLQLPLHLREEVSEMYLSEMPLLLPEDVKQCFDFLGKNCFYEYRIDSYSVNREAWETAAVSAAQLASLAATSASVATAYHAVVPTVAASYPSELINYSQFYENLEEHVDPMLYTPETSTFLHTAHNHAPLKGLQVNLNAYKDNLDYEITPWLYHYVQQHLPQEVEQQIQSFKPSRNKSDKAAARTAALAATSAAPSLVPLLLELNNPLPIMQHRNYDWCNVFFFPLAKSAHVKALTAGQLPEYQIIAYTPLQLQGYHHGELFAAESMSTPDYLKISSKQSQGIDSISLRYKILVCPSEIAYCDKETCHYLLNATLGNVWVERHVGEVRVYAKAIGQVKQYLKIAQHINYCIKFNSLHSLDGRQFRSREEVDAPIANLEKEIQKVEKKIDAIRDELNNEDEELPANVIRRKQNRIKKLSDKIDDLEEKIKVWESYTGEFQWDEPFFGYMSDLHLMKSLPSWQRFFGYYDHTHLYYNYTLRGLHWPKSKTVEEKISNHADPEQSISDVDVKEWFVLPDFDHDLSIEQYQELCALYPWREDVYFGRTACYRMLAAYHQGNRAKEDYLSQYLHTDYQPYPVDSLSRLMQLHAFAGFIMVPITQLEQSFAQGLGISTTLSASDMVSSAALAALPIDSSFYVQAQKLWEQRQIELSSASHAVASTATGVAKPPKKTRSKQPKQTKSVDGQNTVITVEVGRIAYYLSFLQDLQRTLKQELGTEIDVIGYALGTKYVYLDVITWDWELFLEKAMPLEQSELAGRYGVSDFVFHSFFRACDSLPLTSQQ